MALRVFWIQADARHMRSIKDMLQRLLDPVDVLFLPGPLPLFELLDEVLPEAIVLDVDLPRRDVLRCLQAIRDRGRTAQLPVLLWSGSRRSPEVAACQRLGVQGVALKPADADELPEALDALVALLRADRRGILG